MKNLTIKTETSISKKRLEILKSDAKHHMEILRLSELDITIKQSSDMNNNNGLAYFSGKRSKKIEIKNTRDFNELRGTLAHEACHINQFVTGKLICEGKKSTYYGEDLSKLAYDRQPWEIHANDYALAFKIIKNIKTYVGTKIR